MARRSIIEKLKSALHRTITTEMQVVYILVEVRKLLENNDQNHLFPVLNLYCNWVVHTKLSASPVADSIVRLFDELMYRRANNTLDTTLEDKAIEFFDERRLRDELRMFLESSDLPQHLCLDPSLWQGFRKRLAGVIEDVPLELRPLRASNPTHFVESVIVKNKSTNDTFHVEWQMIMHSQPLVEIAGGKMTLKGKRTI